MSNIFKDKKINTKLWYSIAWTAAIFSFVICILVIANYLQSSSHDPVNVKAIDVLTERFIENPEDNELRDKIRELDLLSRKAYFTNQWQIKTGGLLLILGISLLVISLQVIEGSKRKQVKHSDSHTPVKDIQKATRKWIIVSSAALLLITFIVGSITYNDLGKLYNKPEKVVAENKESEKPANKIQQSDETITSSEKGETEPKNSDENRSSDIVSKTEAQSTKSEPKKELSPKVKSEKKSSAPSAEKEKIKATTSKKVRKSDNNFTAFRGNYGDGVINQKSAPTDWDGTSGKNIKWKIPIPLQGYNSPVIWKNKIFLSGASKTKREVYCLDKNSGKILWTANANQLAGSPSAPDVTPDTGHAAASMTTEGKNVYVIFSNGDILAFNMSGKKVWGKNLGLPKNHYGHSSSLIIHNKKIIVQYDHSGSAHLMALNTANGKEVWKTKREVKISWASPVLVKNGNSTEVVVCAEPFISSYNPDTGAEIWKVDCISGEVGPSIAYSNGIIFGINEYSALTAIKMGATPETLWTNDEYLSDVPSPVANDKYLFVATSYGVMVCYDAKTGEKYWENEFSNGFYSSPLLLNDLVYILDREGIMHIFKADKEYKSVGESKLGEKSDCTPAFSDGKIYIRSAKNLYCIGK